MGNSVLAGNRSGSALSDCSGNIESIGHNLLQSPTGCQLQGGGSSDLQGVTALLGDLQDNGASVVGASNASIVAVMLTQVPASASELIDGGAPAGCRDAAGELFSTDQRGRPRVVDGPDPDLIAICDIGATEHGGLQVPAFLLVDGFEQGPGPAAPSGISP
jgi:hypothetical protein